MKQLNLDFSLPADAFGNRRAGTIAATNIVRHLWSEAPDPGSLVR